MTNQSADQNKVREWLEVREKAGRKIDPETAEVIWNWGVIGDPYEVDPELQEECGCVGRHYFARSPGSTIWVWFGDLPKPTRDALSKRIEAGDFDDFFDSLLAPDSEQTTAKGEESSPGADSEKAPDSAQKTG